MAIKCNGRCGAKRNWIQGYSLGLLDKISISFRLIVGLYERYVGSVCMSYGNKPGSKQIQMQ